MKEFKDFIKDVTREDAALKVSFMDSYEYLLAIKKSLDELDPSRGSSLFEDVTPKVNARIQRLIDSVSRDTLIRWFGEESD